MKLFEKTLTSETKFEGRIIKVLRDTVELENGKTSAREVVCHNGGVCVAALTEQNEVLLVRQFRYPYKEVLLELPAGKLEKGEDPFEAVKREQMEETGTAGENYISLGNLYPSPGYCGEIIRIWACRVAQKGEMHLDEDEFLEVERIPLDKAVEMVLNNEIPDSKTQVGIVGTAALGEAGQLDEAPMRRTFITRLPNKAGAFLKATRIVAQSGANITRVSYNKAVDLHVLFLEVSGSQAQLDTIAVRLNDVGYILNEDNPGRTILLEFHLPNVPSAVLPVLELIDSFNFNITYMSGQENDTDHQDLKVGIYIQDPAQTKVFLDRAAKLCEMRVLNYDKSQKVLDNTVFYLSFAHQLASTLHLPQEDMDALIADSNLLMQHLDEKGEAPHKTFSYIGKIAEMLHSFKGENFRARISQRSLFGGFTMHIIEPPCGGNTYMREKTRKRRVSDGGCPCYKDEMLKIFRSLFPNFDNMERTLIVTHADIDHCGLHDLFDTFYVNEETRLNFALQNNGLPDLREQNRICAPYNRICKLMTGYTPPDMHTLRVIEHTEPASDAPISPRGTLEFEGLTLRVFDGNGGHFKGEIVLVDDAHRIVFSGDIMVNIKGFSKEQYDFNLLAPYLMTTVNLDSRRAAAERKYLQSLFPTDVYTYCCGHGAIMDPNA